MFVINNTWGNHTIYTYDINKHPFIQYFKNLYNENILETLQLNNEEYLESINEDTDVGILSGSDTDLHKKFYSDIKNNDEFKKIYCMFIKDIYNYFFPNETFMIFQSYPSIRIQYCNGKTIPPHKDSDHLSNHPLGEKNFLIPITKMINTNSIFIESEPDKKDFQSIHLNPGELFYFNGNTCTHYNEKNVESE